MAETDMIKYSIIVPVYNVEQYLRRCIDSILSQDYPSNLYEIVLVDDGSVDGSEEICDRYSHTYKNVRTIHQDNMGLLQARGTGVKNSSGEYLLFIDSDDYIENNLLSGVDSYINKFSPDFLVFGYIKDKRGKSVKHTVTNQKYEVLDKMKMLERFASSDDYNSIWNKVVRGDLLRTHANEIYHMWTNMGEDKLQTVYLLKYSSKILLISDCSYHYVIRDSSIAHSKTEKDIRNMMCVYDTVGNVLESILDESNADVDIEKMIISKHRAVAINGIMEHIFKLNKRTDLLKADKCRALTKVMDDNEQFFVCDRQILSRIKIYNRIRYVIMMKRRFDILLAIDHILKGFQMITGNI